LKPVRVAVVIALLVVAAGVLGTPWMQVVQEHTRMEEVVYTLTETHISDYVTTVEEPTRSWIAMQTKVNFNEMYGVIPYVMSLIEGQLVKVELQSVPGQGFSVFLGPHTTGSLIFPWGPTVCSWTSNGTDMEYPAACIYEQGQPPRCEAGCRVPITGEYLLYFKSHKDVTVDLRVLIVDYRTNTLTVATTEFSTVLQTSEFTTTWYNTTYKRPLG
jgi:hypothetical protein